MSTKRGLHLCIPSFDNLGDDIASLSTSCFFRTHNLEVELATIDILKCKSQARFLDERIPEFNSEYDFIVIGPGGYLSLGLIEHIFQDTDAWSKIRVPIILLGVGIIANVSDAVWYTCVTRNDSSHLSHALQTAAVISVRDLRSWLIASRIAGNDAEKIFLAGCPTIGLVGTTKMAGQPSHDLLLNLPFHHDSCRKFQEPLIEAAKILLASVPSIKWVCHSRKEWESVKQIQNQINIKFDIAYPKSVEEVRETYSSCRIALVTKMHAGLFSFANRVPFGFFSYDMKCDALLEMIVDFPHDFSVHIDRLEEADTARVLQRIIGNLGKHGAQIQRAMEDLSGMFERESLRVGKRLSEIIS